MVIDPVRGMWVDEKTTPYKSEYDGRVEYFCAAICKQTFDRCREEYPARDQPPPIHRRLSYSRPSRRRGT